ncbi:MAG: methyltransferase domain-containing protein [Bacteroidota bacterium]
MMDFTLRSRQPELMDDPNLRTPSLEEAYQDINRCNRLLGGDGITLQGVWQLVKEDITKEYVILDMGCGDGTILRKLSSFLSKRSVQSKLIGVDLRDDVLEIARKKSEGFPNIQFEKRDILKTGPEFSCDIVINTLTMHHFEEERLLDFLNAFIQLARVGVVINDLQRSRLAYTLFKVFSFFFIKTKIAKVDGLISISKGFRKSELVAIAENIPNMTHTISWKWAFRYLWIMKSKSVHEG